MNIEKIVSKDTWWEVAQECEYATFFHSPLWHRLATTTFDHCTDRTIEAVTDDGVQMVLPLLQTGTAARGMMKELNSTFAGCYGGVIADGPVEDTDLAQIYNYVQRWDVASLQVNGNPLWDSVDHTAILPDEAATDDFTHILPIENKTFDDITAGFTDGHQSGMHKGQRMGVTIREATSLEDYRAYFGAYEDCLRRWENPTSEYPWRLFKNGCDLANEYPDHLRLWLAEVDEEVIAGAWFFYWNDHVDYWHAASYEEYFDHRPNNVLLPHVIKDALNRGYRFVDFNPSGGHTGVARFKKHFGAEKWSIRRWKMKDRTLDFIRRAKNKVTGSS